MKLIFPNYKECVTNVSNSLLKYYGLQSYHNSLKELDEALEEKTYKNIVLILYDGMGANLLRKHLPENSFLRTHFKRDIHAVFPPTTTASTTSVLSGLNPCEHGWLGWDLYFKEINETVTMFLNTKKDTNEKVSEESVSEDIFSYESIIEKIAKKVKSYQLMPFGVNGFSELQEMNERIESICSQDEKTFTYAYYDEPDYTMHDVGTNDEITKKLFEKINESTKNLCDCLTDTLVIIIADHGHINAKGITIKDYDDIYPLLSQNISIEGRACAFFIKEGRHKEFEELFEKYFKEDFILYSKQEVIEKNIFGCGKEHERFRESLGDYLLIAKTNKYFREDENSIKLFSMHGGITEDEVLVPLILVKKK